MNVPPEQAIAVFITAANLAEASRLAEMLVEKQLAACVQLLPQIQSIYRWEGKIERQPEILLMAKTIQARFAELEREVVAVHSYATPEIVALPIVAGSAPYLEWLSGSLKSTAAP